MSWGGMLSGVGMGETVVKNVSARTPEQHAHEESDTAVSFGWLLVSAVLYLLILLPMVTA